METDLSVLPLYFSSKSDIVLTDEIPPEKFIRNLQSLQISPPIFKLKKCLENGELDNLQFNRLLPWGWSPAMHKKFLRIKTGCSDAFKSSPVFSWNPAQKDLYSRRFALKVLNQILVESSYSFFISEGYIPRICSSQADLENLFKKWETLLVKSPWSSSGRGLQPITHQPVHPKVWEKILAVVKDQGFVMAEPLLNKVFDMAFEFEINKGNLIFYGMSYFMTDKKGQYQGNYLNGLPENLEAALHSFLKNVIPDVKSSLENALRKSKLMNEYEGIFGVDTLVYEDVNGQFKVNPCLEINLRHNMGYLSLFLEKLINPNKKGVFRTYFQPGKSFFDFKCEMEQKHPLQIENHKITSGFFSLIPVQPTTQFGAYILV